MDDTLLNSIRHGNSLTTSLYFINNTLSQAGAKGVLILITPPPESVNSFVRGTNLPYNHRISRMICKCGSARDSIGTKDIERIGLV